MDNVEERQLVVVEKANAFVTTLSLPMTCLISVVNL